jgi:hypothetical protein
MRRLDRDFPAHWRTSLFCCRQVTLPHALRSINASIAMLSSHGSQVNSGTARCSRRSAQPKWAYFRRLSWRTTNSRAATRHGGWALATESMNIFAIGTEKQVMHPLVQRILSMRRKCIGPPTQNIRPRRCKMRRRGRISHRAHRPRPCDLRSLYLNIALVRERSSRCGTKSTIEAKAAPANGSLPRAALNAPFTLSRPAASGVR